MAVKVCINVPSVMKDMFILDGWNYGIMVKAKTSLACLVLLQGQRKITAADSLIAFVLTKSPIQRKPGAGLYS